jgi:hypothetical protein
MKGRGSGGTAPKNFSVGTSWKLEVSGHLHPGTC